MRTRNGFSLLELLASTVILGVLITTVLAPLARLFESTGHSGQALRVSTQAQEVAEYVRGQWKSYPRVMVKDVVNPKIETDQNKKRQELNQNRYDRTCFSLPTFANMTSAISVQALDRSGGVTGSLTYSACPNPLTPPSPLTVVPMKRLVVTLTASDGSRSSLTLDVPRPAQ